MKLYISFRRDLLQPDGINSLTTLRIHIFILATMLIVYKTDWESLDKPGNDYSYLFDGVEGVSLFGGSLAVDCERFGAAGVVWELFAYDCCFRWLDECWYELYALLSNDIRQN